MNPLSLFLAGCSLTILVLSILLKRITDSRSTLLNCGFGSAFLLFAAYHAVSRQKPEWIVVMPFLALMLFLGRTIGLWFRSRKEPELLPHARLLTIATSVCLVAAVAAWFSR